MTYPSLSMMHSPFLPDPRPGRQQPFMATPATLSLSRRDRLSQHSRKSTTLSEEVGSGGVLRGRRMKTGRAAVGSTSHSSAEPRVAATLGVPGAEQGPRHQAEIVSPTRDEEFYSK